MRRRDFIAALAGVAAWPVAARAQQAALPVIGFLSALGSDDWRLSAVHRGLADTGHVIGRNVAVESASPRATTTALPQWPTNS